MKKYFLILFCLAYCLSYSQNKQKCVAPILFDTTKTEFNTKRDRLIIKEVNLIDSLRVGFNVKVEFKYPLRDINKAIIINSIEIQKLEIKLLTSGKVFQLYSNQKKQWTAIEHELWNKYANLLMFWYSNQPYEKMSNRDNHDKIVYFAGVFYSISN